MKLSPAVHRPSPAEAQALVARVVQAQAHIAAGRAAEGDALLRPLLSMPGIGAEAAYLLAVSAVMQGQVEPALALAGDAVAQRPDTARYQFALGRARKLAGDLAGAEAAYRAALAREPGHVEAMVSLGIVLKTRGEFDAAIAQYEHALALQPRLTAAHANRANARALRAEKAAADGFDAGVDDETLDAQGRAVALDPGNAVLHRNYGVLLLQARRRMEAVAAFNEALTIDPGDVEACLRIGSTLTGIGDLANARLAYETWLVRNPPSAPVMRALAGVLTRAGQVDLALDWARKTLQLERDGDALIALGNALMQARRHEESLARCREGLELNGRRLAQYPTLLLGLNYLHEDPAPIFDAHRDFGSLLPVPRERPTWRPRPQRLRVGYVSGDFVRHSVSYFFGGLLAHHDRERFEVVCYHNNAINDAVTERLRAFGDRWVECDSLSDDALVRNVRADGIDILVDLSGHTHGSRIFAFAQGAAPVQLAYLGYPTVSGVPAIDFRITDGSIDTGDLPEMPGDRPLLLSRSMFCYGPPETAPALVQSPGLERGHVTFGSFNNIAKLTDRTLALWAATMRAVPGSRLLLKANAMAQPGNRADIERFMVARGIAADRLELIGWTPDTRSHLALYNEVDIALDSIPYNGATTTCESLWMGVPVVTLRGATHTSRMGASILHAAGLGDWVADDEAQYVRIAEMLVCDLEAASEWRLRAREHLRASALLDAPGMAAAFCDALDTAWQRAASLQPLPVTLDA